MFDAIPGGTFFEKLISAGALILLAFALGWALARLAEKIERKK